MSDAAGTSDEAEALEVRRRWARLVRAVGPFPLALAALLGVLGGVGIFTFGYGQGASYLVDNPAACANCHVMQGHFESWQASSHHHVASCNDCHLPHDELGKWVTKGDNGFFHALAFTLGDFPEPIQIKARNRRVTQGACIDCHAQTVHEMLPFEPRGEAPLCARCHFDVGHAGRGGDPSGALMRGGDWR